MKILGIDPGMAIVGYGMIGVEKDNIELLTYTSPGDYGGKKGKLNPSWWSLSYTQYGDLVSLSINGSLISK